MGCEASSSTQPGTSTNEMISPNSNNNENFNEHVTILPLSSILSIEHDYEPVLINFVIRQMINDPDQGIDIF